nr:hypothetical protein [Bacteroidota bacterium]
MKNLKYTGLLFASLLLVSVAPLAAQDLSSAKQEVKKNSEKTSQDVEKIKAEQQEKANSVKKEATSIKNQVTDKTTKQIDEVKKEGQGIISEEDRYAQVKKGYKKRMANAKTEEERAELEKKMMAELEKIKNGTKDGGTVKGTTVKDGEKSASELKERADVLKKD